MRRLEHRAVAKSIAEADDENGLPGSLAGAHRFDRFGEVLPEWRT
jgi:hypothetical protein